MIYYFEAVCAGFPSPAGDYTEARLDLNDYCVRHPAATFYVRVEGDSMEGLSIFEGDVAVVDKSLEPRQNDVVVAVVEGEFVLKRFFREPDRVLLLPANPRYPPLVLDADWGEGLVIWGVVTHVVHRLRA